MRAVVVDRWMDPAELAVREAPEPQAGPGSVVIDVEAAGANFFDTLLVQGRYQVKPAFPFVPGGEAAGVIRAVGEGVTGHRVGDRVIANVLPCGAFAERVAVPAKHLIRMPDAMTFEEGAAIPIVYPTSYASLVYRAALAGGETLLVHAAAGGVGLAAVQIGKALGATVIATAGGADKLEVARAAGADVLIDYRTEDFVERVRQATGGRGADVIFDSVGGDVFDRSLKCLAWCGRLVVVGFASGRIPEVKANRILLKNIAVTGIHWGAYLEHDPARVDDAHERLMQLYREGAIRPAVWKTFPLEELPAALAALAGRATTGKVIIRP